MEESQNQEYLKKPYSDYKDWNLHEKLLAIADMAGVLQKNKAGYNYKYVPEEDVQAKVTAGMQKYGVALYPSFVPGTLTVMPYHYEKPKTKKVRGDDGKDVIVDYNIPVNEIIVSVEVNYQWVNVSKPLETHDCRWAYVGQMEDAAQALGAGATYGNRYFLMKALQLATSEDEPDAYRSKQKEAADFELTAAIKEIVDAGTALIGKGIGKDVVGAAVAKYNDGESSPSTIRNVDVCNLIKDEFDSIRKNNKTNKQQGKK